MKIIHFSIGSVTKHKLFKSQKGGAGDGAKLGLGLEIVITDYVVAKSRTIYSKETNQGIRTIEYF